MILFSYDSEFRREGDREGLPRRILEEIAAEHPKDEPRRKLTYLDEADNLKDLAAPPGNRLEALKGTRAGQHSIRINDQWRICFRWQHPHAYQVEITDYH